MRYSQTREQSAEVLRLVLPELGKHPAAFSPIAYAVWYEHLAGINPSLAAALDAKVSQGLPLSDCDMNELYGRYVAPPDGTALEAISASLQSLMSNVDQTASQTGVEAGAFGAQLANLVRGLHGHELSSEISATLSASEKMVAAINALQGQFAENQREVNKLRSELERVRSDALVDPLTGVANRRGFEAHLSTMVQTPCPKGMQHYLLMLDIDHFKKVNDKHGHVVGDQVLRALGGVLRSEVKEGHSASRYGGEEFAVLMPAFTLDGSTHVAERIRAKTRAIRLRSRTTQEVVASFTVSAGLSALQPGEDSEALIARADAALYHSKTNGRDRLSVF